jgi:hypothetical protein
VTVNRRLLIVLIALVLRADAALAQNLEIDIEGPWIYNVDNQFKDESGQLESVLIAMTPSVDKHIASFSTGDGFVIDKPGVYCVGFDGLCAPAHNGGKTSLPGKVLRIKAPNGWYWYSKLNATMIYLILPLPDGYANDGVYRMKFGSKFGTYGSEKKQTIGLSLRYANGPSTINLSSNCSSPAANSCPFDGLFQDQDNSGTLRITAKAPDDPKDNCDHHVRLAYHRMLLAIDSQSLQQGQNVNKDHGYVDLPEYDSGCYGADPQNDGGLEARHPETGQAASVDDVATQLNKIVDDLGKQGLSEFHLFRQELAQEAITLRINKDDPSKGKVPSYSQLTHIQFLLNLSITAIDDLLRTDDKPRSALKVAKGDEEALVSYAVRIRSALSGKDCRVAQMLVP